jgi:ubiquinone biosynthesis protein
VLRVPPATAENRYLMVEPDWIRLRGVAGPAIERLLPPRYAVYRPLVEEGLVTFLEGLPAARRAALASRQAALPVDAPADRRLVELLRSSPVLHKLGQTLARDRRLDPALRRSLQLLETLPPSLSREELEPLLGDALAGEDLGEPIAEGSVAVVVACRGRNREGSRVRGVLKVLKPGIEERLAEDLAVWNELGFDLEARSRALGLPSFAWRETLEQVRDLVLAEIDLPGEQRNLEAAAELYRDDARVQVPLLLEGCGPRITAMTRIDGPQVTAAGGERTRRRAARAIVEALIARPFFSTADPVLFHGDPHAGNLVWTPLGRLGLLDWALAARIDQRSLALTVGLLLAASRLDRRAVARAVCALARHAADREAVDRVAGRALRKLRGGAPPGLSWLLALLDSAALEAGARFGSDLLLFRKSLLTLDGVVRDLDPAYPMTLDLALAGLGHLLVEWPGRLLSSPTSRRFASHLSNLDLLSLLWLAPARAHNYWLESARSRMSQMLV